MIAKKRKLSFFVRLIIFVAFGFQLLAVFSSIKHLISMFDSSGDKNINFANGFEISEYNIVLDVMENNIINVTENLTIDFTSKYKQGIYKFIPQWMEYTGKNGKTIKRKSIITDYRAVGDEYSIDTVKKKKRIKIGSSSEYVKLGEKTYVIKYTYDMGKDPYKGFDELIFHAYGDYWGTEIKNASVQVNMPKNISGAKVNFFMDKYREKNANSYVDYTVSGNTIYAKFNQEKYYKQQKNEYCSQQYYIDQNGICDMPSYMGFLRKSLTVDIELPEGYFVGGSWNYGFISYILCLIIFCITIWNFIRWKKYGKNFPNQPETVEFYPPEKYSSAEVGYIYGKQTNKKLTISLIVQLASKGYIRIDNLKDKNESIQITNLRTQTVKQLSNKFSVVQPLSTLERIVYNRLFENQDIIILSEHKTFYKAFSDVESSLKSKLKDMIDDKVSAKKRRQSTFSSILVLLIYLVSYCLVEDMDPSWGIIYILSFACIIINICFTFIMKRKTEYGEKIIAQVKGFRNFLVTVEKDKLEALVMKNPNYFYDILPYTYVLGISKKWISKFENIPIAERDIGNYDYNRTNYFNDLYDNIYYPDLSRSSSGCSSCGGGGCSSCGGGCSSCGGGCSSCGGGS